MAWRKRAHKDSHGGALPGPEPAAACKPPPPRRGWLQALGWFIIAALLLLRPLTQRGVDLGIMRRLGRPPIVPALQVAGADLVQPGHGRAADAPHRIPLKGWRDILWRSWKTFNRDNIPQVAGGVAFFALLAVFPGIGVFVSLYGLFSDVDTAQAQLSLLQGVLPEAALQLVGDQMLRLAAARHTGLGVAFVVSLVVSLWSANAGMKALIVGLNVAFEEREKRSLIRLNLLSLSFTVGMLVFLLASIGAIVEAPLALAFLGRQNLALSVLRWPMLLLAAMAGLALLYRFGPSRNHEQWRWVSWGSVAAALLWLVASLLFSFYVAHFGSYDRTYGSLGAAVGFMTWIWISTITVLFGAELNSEIEHQTAVDTTVADAPRVMGQRGAHMADTLGETFPAKTRPQPKRPPG
jgi:membrane protein